MVKLSDKLNLELSEYYFKSDSRSDYGIELPFYLLSFVISAEIFYGENQIDEKEYKLFLDKSLDYIIVEGLNVKRRGFIITTPEYREKYDIIEMLIHSCSDFIDSVLMQGGVNEELETIIENLFYEFKAEYNKYSYSLKVPKIDDAMHKFLVKYLIELVGRYENGEFD